MATPEPTEQDKERFRKLILDAPNVEVRPVFGNLGGFVNGKHCSEARFGRLSGSSST
jgi:hypothetical protein